MACDVPIDFRDQCLSLRLLYALPGKRQAFLRALSVSAAIVDDALFMEIQPLKLFHKGIVILTRGGADDKYH